MPKVNRLYTVLSAAVLFTVITILLPTIARASDTIYTLNNGMTVILKENHSSPMIASIVFVKSGSKYEAVYENGITHFLEHLLFDGTVHLSREQLDASISDLGGYINAFTQQDLTAYLVLMPRQYIDYGLTVQADMLFNSTIPDDQLAKERKVVVEEIKRDADSPGSAAEKFFTEKAYAQTSYTCPVLGYRAFIENIPRDAVIDYWKRYYRPERMTALIIGDFETDTMRQTVAAIFGAIVDSTMPSASTIDTVDVGISGGHEGRIVGQHIYDTVANVGSTYIKFSFEAPRFSDSGYLAMDLLGQYLNMDDVSPLMVALRGGSSPLATEASVSLTAYAEFSRLEINAVTDNPANSEAILRTIQTQVENIAAHNADKETITGIKTTVKCQNIYNAEKLHYYGFIVAPMIMTMGWDFIQTYPERLAQVEWADCQTAARTWLTQPNFVATIVRPIPDSTRPAYRPVEMAEESVRSHFDSVTFPKYDLTRGHPLVYPRTDSVHFELVDRAEYYREVMPNGLMFIIKSNPDTRVFAMNIIGKNRSAGEPDSLAGITDFVNHCIEKGTVTRDAFELQRDLSKIGANVTLYDNPWIPYDDRYTTREFSFMKFETIDEFAPKGFHLFTEMLLYPAFDSTESENVRRSLVGALRRSSASPSDVARDLFYGTLFEGKAYAKSIAGTPMTIGTATLDDLRTHHRRFYSPNNMVLSIVSNLPVEQVKQWIYLRFNGLPTADFNFRADRPDPVLGVKKAHTDLEKEQINIYLGSVLPPAGDTNVAALSIAASILSDRLFENLRERQGLAYSVGAGASFDRDFGWYYATIGTASQNYQRALDGILLEMDKLGLDGPLGAEITRAKNQLWGRLTSAKLSSINQAYYLGMNEYLGYPVDYDKRFLSALATVNFEAIRRVASQYFRTDAYVLTTAGKGE